MASPRAEQQIAHLLQRQQEAPILEKKTRLPYGWAIWLRALPPLPRPGHARDIVAVLLPRPQPAGSGRLPALNMLVALRQLLWQGWDPPPRDQRWMRWTSAVISALLHLLFLLGLLWIAIVSMPLDPQGSEGERVQVEFLGQGAQDGGGQAAPGDGEAAAQAAAVQNNEGATAQPSAAASDAPVPPQAQPVAAEAAPQPAPQAAAQPAPQPGPQVAQDTPVAPAAPPQPPVQATEVAEATHEFVVPPITVPHSEVSFVPRTPQAQVRERSVQPLQAPPSVAVPMQQVRVPVRSAQVPQVQVRERQITPLQPVTAPAPPQIAAPAVTVQVPQRELQVRERTVQPLTDVPAPAARVPVQVNTPEPARAQAPAVRERSIAERPALSAAPAAASSSTSTSSTPPSSTPRTAGGAQQGGAAAARSSAAPSASPSARAAADPGNWATPARGDDWGASTSNRDGAAAGAAAARDGQGLFNADGSVRVPGDQPAAGAERGAPGGDNDGWSKERIAQSGTWLKRPPYDYTPTSFDKYWVPNESLLAEWVRKGVKSIEIPLPGSGTRISCVISVLQFGGGCGLSDPNMQEQPAIARPPPDIPFKKELQEDNGSR